MGSIALLDMRRCEWMPAANAFGWAAEAMPSVFPTDKDRMLFGVSLALIGVRNSYIGNADEAEVMESSRKFVTEGLSPEALADARSYWAKFGVTESGVQALSLQCNKDRDERDFNRRVRQDYRP
jgi:hypothetical protein